MPARISIIASRELRAVMTAMRGLDRANRAQIRKQTKSVIVPAWREAVAREASTDLERRVFVSSARAAVSDRNVTLRAGGGGRRLSGGLTPSQHNRAVEFGGNRERTTTYRSTSRRGKPYQITRHTQRQLPPFRRSGYVFYPAVARIAPRVAALWAQTFARGIHEALEGKQ